MSVQLQLLLLALAGGAGAALRYIADTLLRERAGLHPGTSTLLINALGCLVAGAAGAALVLTAPYPELQPPFSLALAVCAGFTTFSTASLDALRAALERSARRFALVTAGQLLACGLAFTLAYLVTHALAAA